MFKRILRGWMLLVVPVLFPVLSYAYQDEYGYPVYEEEAPYQDFSDGGRYAYNGQREVYSRYAEDDGGYYYDNPYPRQKVRKSHRNRSQGELYAGRGGGGGGGLPSQISPHGEKVIVVDPNVHRWGAYSPDGRLIRSGLMSAGARYCPDIRRGCKTRSGTFRIYSLGSRGCFSRKYPVGKGGAPMPYCMYFNGGQGLHGSNQVVAGNVSHGCVRLHVSDAAWIRFNFANVGTKVIVRPY